MARTDQQCFCLATLAHPSEALVNINILESASSILSTTLTMPVCKHEQLRVEPSKHAREVGYEAPTHQELCAATCTSGKGPGAKEHDLSTFPYPLVLPGDELSWDPEYEPQSFTDWRGEPERNPVTSARRTVYFVPTPSIAKEVSYVRDWAIPNTYAGSIGTKRKTVSSPDRPVPSAKPKDVLSYLQAFYHGLSVKMLSKPKPRFVPWSDSNPKSPRIGLHIGSEIIGIRTRPSQDGFFSGQLNLDDLLDAAIAILPKDAYALLMLVDHDLCEGEEDDFCCGHAYGGSRVAVVSSARYNPSLDEVQGVEREHAWPASHCQMYVDACCREGAEPAAKKAKISKAKKGSRAVAATSALRSAVDSFNSLPAPSTPQALSNLWLGRICKTASHELGHCFGMDHCVYRACIMQGTAGLSEDARQPPYLCPVDLAKVLHATGADICERCRKLAAFCDRFKDDRLFSAFGAWCRSRLKGLSDG